MRTQHSNKRVVSKTHYAAIMGGRLMGYAASSLFFVVGMIGMIFTGLATVCMLFVTFWNGFSLYALLVSVVIGMIFLFFIGLMIMGKEGVKSVMQEEPVVPLTRQTALDIPPEESLVRASSADTLAYETILLRPAQNESETASDELLRPHRGE